MSNYHIYVIELESRVAGNPLFRDENPNRDWSKPCLYVGQTAHAPELRLKQHREERYSSPFVRRYGLRLRPDLYERHETRSPHATKPRTKSSCWRSRYARKDKDMVSRLAI